ncbi:unnamed protein product [Somion occarium]|uniref:Uncharacterized protein n=1 Tax=Somion occarium TaxID=3059160 RepID=A0ABP1DNV3_9APHY
MADNTSSTQISTVTAENLPAVVSTGSERAPTPAGSTQDTTKTAEIEKATPTGNEDTPSGINAQPDAGAPKTPARTIEHGASVMQSSHHSLLSGRKGKKTVRSGNNTPEVSFAPIRGAQKRPAKGSLKIWTARPGASKSAADIPNTSTGTPSLDSQNHKLISGNPPTTPVRRTRLDQGVSPGSKKTYAEVVTSSPLGLIRRSRTTPPLTPVGRGPEVIPSSSPIAALQIPHLDDTVPANSPMQSFRWEYKRFAHSEDTRRTQHSVTPIARKVRTSPVDNQEGFDITAAPVKPKTPATAQKRLILDYVYPGPVPPRSHRPNLSQSIRPSPAPSAISTHTIPIASSSSLPPSDFRPSSVTPRIVRTYSRKKLSGIPMNVDSNAELPIAPFAAISLASKNNASPPPPSPPQPSAVQKKQKSGDKSVGSETASQLVLDSSVLNVERDTAVDDFGLPFELAISKVKSTPHTINFRDEPIVSQRRTVRLSRANPNAKAVAERHLANIAKDAKPVTAELTERRRKRHGYLHQRNAQTIDNSSNELLITSELAEPLYCISPRCKVPGQYKGIIRNGELVMKRPTAGRLVHDHTAKDEDAKTHIVNSTYVHWKCTTPAARARLRNAMGEIHGLTVHPSAQRCWKIVVASIMKADASEVARKKATKQEKISAQQARALKKRRRGKEQKRRKQMDQMMQQVILDAMEVDSKSESDSDDDFDFDPKDSDSIAAATKLADAFLDSLNGRGEPIAGGSGTTHDSDKEMNELISDEDEQPPPKRQRMASSDNDPSHLIPLSEAV